MSRPLVIKIGGSTLGSADTTFRDVAALASAGNVPVVVHGGGAEASRWLEAMQIPSRFERGLRVTDERVLPVVVAVFAGLVNKRIVAAINAAGAEAVGLCGADGRILECRIAAPELGFVGEPVAVNTRAITALHSSGIVPVIGPIGVVPGEEADQLVNVNADTVAGNIAAALNAERLVFLTDVEGVRGVDGQTIPRLSAAAARDLVRDGTIAGGMIPKVEACLHALAMGVPVQIVDGRRPGMLRSLEGSGTVFTP
ncbi:MAG TPA: acetylglutamate kinase [Tepidiformaceae bacterium]|nr:acetylglutamate kinase [Tepidiformaceae bacterium]